MAEIVEAAPKKIILCCDGTWQSSVSGKHNLPSNITRIARTIAKAGQDKEDGKVWQQIVYYDSGVGSGSLSSLESKRQGATGDGLVVNVLEAYNFVVNNYSPGDKIYCFGFSRGAFTARAIAGMITDLGVMKPDSMQYFASLFAAYQKNTSKYTFRKTKEYFEWKHGKAPFVPESQKETCDVKIPWYDMGTYAEEYENSRSIELVGVFDTVGSLGYADSYVHSHASSRQGFEWLNVKWSPYIKHAFHALALDDRRQPFLPTLYYIPNEETISKENEKLAEDEVDWPELTEHRQRIDEELNQERAAREPDLAQVWFTGVHINVGGGTDDAKTDFEGLANITFAWMVEQCRPYLTFNDFTNATLANYLQRMIAVDAEQSLRAKEAAPTGMVGSTVAAITEDLNATKKWLGSFFSSNDKATPKEKMVRTYCFSASVVPPVKPDHWTLFRNQDSYSLMYKAISHPETRTPGNCNDQSTEDHTPLSKLGETREWMHPSVKWRQAKSTGHADKELQYNSEPLKALAYDRKDGVWGWKQSADSKVPVWIPEWPIEAALEEEDESSYSENAELALVDACLDKEAVREFLKEHATAWNKANASVVGDLHAQVYV
ncbi:hypothetical protein HBI24_165720 [Parastagonospora nodorum]|nr:hypothetical protein HBH43_094380 [Parastagonospora nodorum]KAH4257640.1 hypothetical protein HBI03_152940 [Parastagonospora nodorum]KAH4272981.1 hypothetical protein HBI04_141580 [Parastagonospora nodorum]KAH4295629.1 hypothetical protein HBI01_154310 [Parastagonospora nodorum]KAH4298091.1 hypothetical protein HBI02_158650 [Parastagonospora nodorum]